MNDMTQALADARDALAIYRRYGAPLCGYATNAIDALDDLLAAQAPPAVVPDWLPQPDEVEYVGDAGPATDADFVDTPASVPANVTPMRQPRLDLARLADAISAAVYANGDGLSVTEAIGALELAKLGLLKERGL